MRLIVCHGDHLGILINSINSFADSYPQTKIFSANAHQLEERNQIIGWVNQLLHQKHEFSIINFWRYVPPYHKSQNGQWQLFSEEELRGVNNCIHNENFLKIKK